MSKHELREEFVQHLVNQANSARNRLLSARHAGNTSKYFESRAVYVQLVQIIQQWQRKPLSNAEGIPTISSVTFPPME
jgi:hypothetical protein